MKRIVLLLLAVILVAASASQALAQMPPEIEEKMARLNELNNLMQTASQEDYDKFKSEFDSLKAEVDAMVAEFNADKEAKAKAISSYNKGNDALRARRIDDAIRNFRESTQLNPMEPRAQYSLGIALQMKRDYDGALEAFRQASSLDQSYIKAFYAQGVILTRMRQFDDAVEVLRKAVSVPNADADDKSKAFNALGLAFYRQKNYDQAISAYQQATQVDETNDEAWFNLGKAYGEKKDFSSAIEPLQKAVNLKRDARYLTALAEKFNRLGQYNDAATNAGAATGVNSNYAAAWFELGWALENMGKKDEAISAYEKAMKDRNYRQSAEYQIKLIRGEF
ncbi:tetratricopeptide repeat protein [bacterium]|nr:tetratricopeptide repeat protein [bacterium]